MSAVTYARIPHAAHYPHIGGGHDLEQWTYAQPERLPVPEGVPADAEYHSGSRSEGVQSWHYVRTAPLSPGICERCPAAVTP